ncbi:hypothetical protein D5S17_15180 [Pseudonocardiaceae bacterium YIM PH 21723]|nr:hypothetical protein D5S17_15180 [Pseudonocardiaceae bacterium YIM PH 21723]
MKRNTAVLGLAGAISALGMSTAVASGAVFDGLGYHTPQLGTVTTVTEPVPEAATSTVAPTTTTTAITGSPLPAPRLPEPRFSPQPEYTPAPVPDLLGFPAELLQRSADLVGGTMTGVTGLFHS